jgi:heme/copper-type cytochrome/quinol oxidase subunit 2
MIMIMTLILVFVTYVFLSLIATPLADKNTMDSHVLETVWTVVPIVILMFMAFPSLYLLYLMEDSSNPSVRVKVIGHQWYWEYQYRNSWFVSSFDSYIVHDKSNAPLFYNLDVDNRLVLPTLSQLLFLVTSVDVIHS